MSNEPGDRWIGVRPEYIEPPTAGTPNIRGPFDPPAVYVVTPRLPRVETDTATGGHYLITAEGRWRVYDGRLLDGKFREGGWNPSHRVFVAEDGTKKIAALRDGEPKHVDERYLVGQLERAEPM